MRRLYKMGLITILSLSLFACSKITQENFNKLNNNMSIQQVVAILGEPSSSESVNIAGISGQPYGKIKMLE
ncbi:hypothetical protein AYO45_01015 [Gammaproteobacteria bacterium SCGC AG-212-F23]|nr:hypothetical protein AYO45_01015 [Gammaproteobacteria bacterium SCGC AG-212-F23]